MKLLSFEKNGNSARVKFFIDDAEFNDKLNKVWNRQKRWFNIPGFRKGKAPRRVIENEYGSDIFHSSALSLLYPKMVDMIIDEKKENIIFLEEEIFMPMSQEYKPVEVKKEENGVTTEFSTPIYPDLDIDYKNLTVEIEPKKSATKEQIAGKKAVLQRRAGKKSLEKDEKVEKGDFVRLNLKSVVPVNATDEQKKQCKQFENVNGLKLVVEDAAPVAAGLVGHTIDDGNFTMKVTMPEESTGVPELEGKKCDVTCSIVAHKRYYNMDEVAKKQGLKNEQELEEKIKEQINSQYEKIYNEQKKSKMFESVGKLVDDEQVPSALLDAHAKSMIDNISKMADQYGMDPEMFAQMFTKEDNLENGAKKLALNSLKMELGLRAIAKKENIEATNEMIKSYRSDFEEKNGFSLDALSDEQVRSKILEEKVEKVLLDRVKFVEVERNEKAAPAVGETDNAAPAAGSENKDTPAVGNEENAAPAIKLEETAAPAPAPQRKDDGVKSVELDTPKEEMNSEDAAPAPKNGQSSVASVELETPKGDGNSNEAAPGPGNGGITSVDFDTPKGTNNE